MKTCGTNRYFRLDGYFGFRITVSLRVGEMSYMEKLLAGGIKPHNMNLLSEKYSGGKAVCELTCSWDSPPLTPQSVFNLTAEHILEATILIAVPRRIFWVLVFWVFFLFFHLQNPILRIETFISSKLTSTSALWIFVCFILPKDTTLQIPKICKRALMNHLYSKE